MGENKQASLTGRLTKGNDTSTLPRGKERQNWPGCGCEETYPYPCRKSKPAPRP